LAIAAEVMSSWVGPMPPVVKKRQIGVARLAGEDLVADDEQGGGGAGLTHYEVPAGLPF
jgi:hypothetical protein